MARYSHAARAVASQLAQLVETTTQPRRCWDRPQAPSPKQWFHSSTSPCLHPSTTSLFLAFSSFLHVWSSASADVPDLLLLWVSNAMCCLSHAHLGPRAAWLLPEGLFRRYFNPCVALDKIRFHIREQLPLLSLKTWQRNRNLNSICSIVSSRNFAKQVVSVSRHGSGWSCLLQVTSCSQCSSLWVEALPMH